MNTINQVIEELLRTRGQWLQRKKEGVEFSKLKEQVERVMRVRTLRGYGDTEFENGINAMLANGQILVKTDSSRTVHYRLINDPIYQQHMEGTVRQFSTPFRNEDVSVVSANMSNLSVGDRERAPTIPSSVSTASPDRKRQRQLAEEQEDLRIVEELLLAEKQEERERLLAVEQQEEQDRLLAERLLAEQQEQDRLLAERLLAEQQERERVLADRLLAEQQERERVLAERLLAVEQQEEQDRLLAERLLAVEQQEERDLQQEQERQRLLLVEQQAEQRMLVEQQTEQRMLEEQRQLAVEQERLLQQEQERERVLEDGDDDNDDGDDINDNVNINKIDVDEVDVVKLPGMNSREKVERKIERIKRIDNHVTNHPSSLPTPPSSTSKTTTE